MAGFLGAVAKNMDPVSQQTSFSQIHPEDVPIHYRIISLIRRRPYVTLYFALDNQQSRQSQQRMVAIRDIDLTSLNDEARVQVIKLVQQEYDSLRHWHIPYVLPMIDLRYFNGHLYAVSGYPLVTTNLSSTGKAG